MFLLRQVQGKSMMPRLRPDSIVVAVRFYRGLRVNDIVVVRHAGLDKIKRIQGITVDKIYLRGDNSGYSTDSRHFGWLDKRTVRGKVIWPKTLPAKQKSQK